MVQKADSLGPGKNPIMLAYLGNREIWKRQSGTGGRRAAANGALPLELCKTIGEIGKRQSGTGGRRAAANGALPLGLCKTTGEIRKKAVGHRWAAGGGKWCIAIGAV